MSHRIPRELFGLLDVQTEDEQNEGENAAYAEARAPLGAEIVIVARGGDDVY